ncbi:hypothetical protein PUN28_019565 [Cardiocondyla obscurior]|uniref:Uncharacterized protein n=1 Tax=Cardiocondyla obscurior TaxID=286306 RepID=A0AAW2EB45_9HYME
MSDFFGFLIPFLILTQYTAPDLTGRGQNISFFFLSLFSYPCLFALGTGSKTPTPRQFEVDFPSSENLTPPAVIVRKSLQICLLDKANVKITSSKEKKKKKKKKETTVTTSVQLSRTKCVYILEEITTFSFSHFCRYTPVTSIVLYTVQQRTRIIVIPFTYISPSPSSSAVFFFRFIPPRFLFFTVGYDLHVLLPFWFTSALLATTFLLSAFLFGL